MSFFPLSFACSPLPPFFRAESRTGLCLLDRQLVFMSERKDRRFQEKGPQGVITYLLLEHIHYMEPGLHREMADLSGIGSVRNILSYIPESKKAIKGRWAGNFITGQGSHWTDCSVGQFGWIK